MQGVMVVEGKGTMEWRVDKERQTPARVGHPRRESGDVFSRRDAQTERTGRVVDGVGYPEISTNLATGTYPQAMRTEVFSSTASQCC